MDAYSPAVERKMKRLFDSLRETEPNRVMRPWRQPNWGTVVSIYIRRVLRCDPKTIRRGLAELEAEDDLDTNRVPDGES